MTFEQLFKAIEGIELESEQWASIMVLVEGRHAATVTPYAATPAHGLGASGGGGPTSGGAHEFPDADHMDKDDEYDGDYIQSSFHHEFCPTDDDHPPASMGEDEGALVADDALSTTSSGRFVKLDKISPPLISVQVDSNADIMFSTTSISRPNTARGSTQGDHITAYAMIVDAVLRSISDQPQSEIKTLLRNIASHFLGIDQIEALSAGTSAEGQTEQHPIDKIFAEFNGTVGILSSRKERAEFVKWLKFNKCKKDHVDDVKCQLKFSKAIRLAKLIQESCEYVLKAINARVETTVFSYYKKSSADLGREANRVRTAIDALRAFEYTLSSMQRSQDHTDTLNKICKETIRRGLTRFNVLMSSKRNSERQILEDKTSIARFVRSVMSVPGLSAASDDEDSGISPVLDGLASSIADLFDFDYHTQMMNRIFTHLEEYINEEHLNKEDFKGTVKALTEGSEALSAEQTIRVLMSSELTDNPRIVALHGLIVRSIASELTSSESVNDAVQGFIRSVIEQLTNDFVEHAVRHFSFAVVAFPTIREYCLEPGQNTRKDVLLTKLGKALTHKTSWNQSAEEEIILQEMLVARFEESLTKLKPTASIQFGASASATAAAEEDSSSMKPGF